MYIEISYDADISWLNKHERHELKRQLEQLPVDYEVFDMTSKELSIRGKIHDEDAFAEAKYFEEIFEDFDLEWTGRYTEEEFEPDYDQIYGF